MIECPTCSEPLVPIVYGLPTSEAAEEAMRGEVILGGCTVEFDEPSHHCGRCGRSFRSAPAGKLVEVRMVPYNRAELPSGTWKAQFGKGWDWVPVTERDRGSPAAPTEVRFPDSSQRPDRP